MPCRSGFDRGAGSAENPGILTIPGRLVFHHPDFGQQGLNLFHGQPICAHRLSQGEKGYALLVGKLMQELIGKLEKVRDTDGSPVIRNMYLSSDVYKGPHTARAPDLLVGYHAHTAAADATEYPVGAEIAADE